MSSPSVLIVGCGDVGGRLAQQLLGLGWSVSGLRRNVAALPAGVAGIAADLENPQCPTDWPLVAPDYLVYCVAASQHDEAGYQAAYVDGLRHVLAWLAARGQHPRRLLFVSSSSVYEQKGGEWVDEKTGLHPSGPRGQARVDAERGWLDLMRMGVPVHLFRIAGIYGPGRSAVDSLRDGTARRVIKLGAAFF